MKATELKNENGGQQFGLPLPIDGLQIVQDANNNTAMQDPSVPARPVNIWDLITFNKHALPAVLAANQLYEVEASDGMQPRLGTYALRDAPLPSVRDTAVQEAIPLVETPVADASLTPQSDLHNPALLRDVNAILATAKPDTLAIDTQANVMPVTLPNTDTPTATVVQPVASGKDIREWTQDFIATYFKS